MTYAELSEIIQKMTPSQKNSDVTIYSEGYDEFYPLDSDNPYGMAMDDDVLDDYHPYLVIK